MSKELIERGRNYLLSDGPEDTDAEDIILDMMSALSRAEARIAELEAVRAVAFYQCNEAGGNTLYTTDSAGSGGEEDHG